jgi:hypothetical protein
MTKTFDNFNGVDILNMFSAMYSASVINMAQRNLSNHNRYKVLADKYCKDFSIKGIYPYGYVSSSKVAIVFVYGTRNYLEENTEEDLSRTVVDTYYGDSILYFFIDEIDKCTKWELIQRYVILPIENIVGIAYALECTLGIICSSLTLFNHYVSEWFLEIFDEPYLKERKNLDYLIDVYRDNDSSTVVKEINYGEVDYSDLADVCIYQEEEPPLIAIAGQFTPSDDEDDQEEE